MMRILHHCRSAADAVAVVEHRAPADLLLLLLLSSN